MIQRIHIDGYKSLKQVEVAFPGSLTAMMGPNGAGKSNLFDAIDLLRRIVHSSTVEMAFSQHRGNILESFTLGSGGYRAAQAKDSLRMTFEVDVDLSESTIRQTEAEITRHLTQPGADAVEEGPQITEKHLRYRIEIEYLPKTRVLRVVDEELAALRRDGLLKESRTSFLSRVDDGPKKVFRLRLEGHGAHPVEYNVGLPYSLISRPHHPPHYPHINAFKRELAGWRMVHLDPHIMREDAAAKPTEVVGRHGEDLAAFLGTLQDRQPQRFDATCQTLQQLLPAIDSLQVEQSDQGVYRLFVTERGVELPAHSISEGTLTIIALVAVLMPNPSTTLIGLVEPENGLHPFRIGTVARLLETAGEVSSSQIMVSTHNPVLAGCLPEQSLLVCTMGESGTCVDPFYSTGAVMKPIEISEALNPGDEPNVPIQLLAPFFQDSQTD